MPRKINDLALNLFLRNNPIILCWHNYKQSDLEIWGVLKKKKESNNYLETDKKHVPQHLEFNFEIISQASHLLTSVKSFS